MSSKESRNETVICDTSIRGNQQPIGLLALENKLLSNSEDVMPSARKRARISVDETGDASDDKVVWIELSRCVCVTVY